MRIVALLLMLIGAVGCPDRREVIDNVGSAPKAQVDAARDRLHRAEAQYQRRAAEAAAATE